MSSSTTRRRIAPVSATVIDATGSRLRREQLAGEEPLEIRVVAGGASAAESSAARASSAGANPEVRSGDGSSEAVLWVTSTMRTPGQDFALAAGLLHAEGVIAEPGDVREIRYCTDVDEQQYNVVTVHLRGVPRRELGARTLGATASCGVCGTASIDDVRGWTGVVESDLRIDGTLLAGLPARLRAAQPVFDATGGLHAAGLFDASGRAITIAEDIGRHNALDKVLGERFLAGELPAGDAVAVMSSRVSFELVQKAAVAGVPVICAVSAPSNLAVETARRLGVTLAAFARGDRVTVYTHPERVTTG